MKITEETKIKDIIPEGWEIDTNVEYDPILHYCHNSLSISVRQKKFKTIEIYEYILMLSDTTVMYHGSRVSYYQTLKENHPKQYFSIILQMIADVICDKEQDSIWWLDNYELTCRYANYSNYPLGAVFFDTEEHVKQAIEILGDKLKLLI
jgi:hypothetical protein